MPAPIHSVFPAGLGALSARRIDVREPAEFEGLLGHLPRSELVPLGTLPAAAQSWPRSEPLLLICRSGARSLKAARLLAQEGFHTLYNLEGGMLAVREAGLPVEGAARAHPLSAERVRDSLCAAAQALYGPLTPPPCEALFEGTVAFPSPNRAALLTALERLGARARADGLRPEAIDQMVRGMRDLMALVAEPETGASPP